MDKDLKQLILMAAGFVVLVAIGAALITWMIGSTFEAQCKNPKSQFERDVCGYFAESPEDPDK